MQNLKKECIKLNDKDKAILKQPKDFNKCFSKDAWMPNKHRKGSSTQSSTVRHQGHKNQDHTEGPRHMLCICYWQKEIILRMWRSWNPPTLFHGPETSEITVVLLQNAKCRVSWEPAISLSDQEKCIHMSTKAYVHCWSQCHHSESLQTRTIQIPVNWWTSKQNVAHLYDKYYLTIWGNGIPCLSPQGWTLKTSQCVKEASHKSPRIVLSSPYASLSKQVLGQ